MIIVNQSIWLQPPQLPVVDHVTVVLSSSIRAGNRRK